MTKHAKTIDELVAEAARAGGLTALTLWPCAGGWQANARFKRGKAEGWNCVTAADAADGLRRALGGEAPAEAPDAKDIFG